MLSYQHGYHAGNFADVLKHITLLQLLNYMTIKEAPLLYLETHAGRGVYDLQSKQALKTAEAQDGIYLLWEHKAQLPAVFISYIQAIMQLNPDQQLRFYPGSPWFAINALRAQDRVFCAELHSTEFKDLRQVPKHGKQVFYSNTDGVEALKALLPPKERRGLIFLDPSYEIKTDYQRLPKALQAAYQRFSTGVYCLWYPIIDKHCHETLLKGLKKIINTQTLCVEFYLDSQKTGMFGCGLWIINPPYTLATNLKPVLETMRKLFNPGGSHYVLRD